MPGRLCAGQAVCQLLGELKWVLYSGSTFLPGNLLQVPGVHECGLWCRVLVACVLTASLLSPECSDFSPPITVILLVFLCLEGLLFFTFTAVMFGTQIHSICNDETVSLVLCLRGVGYDLGSQTALDPTGPHGLCLVLPPLVQCCFWALA